MAGQDRVQHDASIVGESGRQVHARQRLRQRPAGDRLAGVQQHEVVRERVSLSDAIHRIADRVRAEGRLSFFALFEGMRQRQQIVITFLAMLEMCKLRLIRVYQEEGQDEIVISARGEALANLSPEVDESEYK